MGLLAEGIAGWLDAFYRNRITFERGVPSCMMGHPFFMIKRKKTRTGIYPTELSRN
jgi:hypothetical protein